MAAEPQGEPDLSRSAKVAYLPSAQKLLPSSMDAEKALLCSFLLAPREIGQLCQDNGMGADHFHFHAHGMIYAVLREFWIENEPLDLISVCEFMRNRGTLDNAGGAIYLTDLQTLLGTAANAFHYISILKEKHTLRQIITVCNEFSGRGYTEQSAVTDLLFEAQRKIQAIGQVNAKKRKPFKEILMEVVTRIEHGEESTADISSGLDHLDELVKMRRGNFIVIGGQAKSGKTALAGTIATHAACQGKRVVIVSMEMDVYEITKRMLAAAGNVNVSRISQEPTESEVNGIVRGATAIGDRDIELIDEIYDLTAIVSECRRLHFEKPLDLVVIDYLQLIEWSTGRRGETRQEVVAQVSRTCKKLATQLNCVLIGLSQLNDDGKLRESRSIGQDANVILGVDKRDGGDRVIRICDQRSGVADMDINAVWRPYFNKFENPKPEEAPELVNMGKPAKRTKK